MFIDNINDKIIHSKNFLSENINIKNNKESNNFIKYIKMELGELNNIQKKAHDSIKTFQLDQSETSFNNAIINLQKSSISLKLAIQIRNKIISAYREIMNQQV